MGIHLDLKSLLFRQPGYAAAEELAAFIVEQT